MVFQSNSFCNSFLQHHPTPLAGHRQEKTEKTRFEQEKTDGSAEPSAKTGILSLSDTYTHPQWRQFPWEYRSLRPDTWKSSLLSKNPGGLQKQHQHHHRGNIADHHLPELKFCGDNGAMIAAQGYYQYIAGHTAGLELNGLPTLPIDYE